MSQRLPVVCLPGLTRSTRDFHPLAERLAKPGPRARRVLSLDYRGRGQSQYDTDWRNYNVFTEMADCLAVMDAAGIQHAALVGVSRGGILSMVMAASRPSFIEASVLVDIGPVIDPRGLLAIKQYLGRWIEPKTWDDAVDLVKAVQGKSFTAFSDKDWHTLTRMTFRDDNGHPAADFDPTILKTFEGMDFDKPPPSLWPQFDALAKRPTMVIRGEHSNILSEETLDEMTKRKPDLNSLIVEGQGHAPMLQGAINDRIAAFLDTVDRSGR